MADLDDYIKRMDETATKLLDLVDDEKTSEVQKGRLFAQCMKWYQVRAKLIPSEEGNGLQEMTDVFKSQGGGGSRAAGSAKSGASRTSGSKDGKAIRALIRSLPTHARRAAGDSDDSQREGRGSAGDGGGGGADGVGDDARDVDGARRSA